MKTNEELSPTGFFFPRIVTIFAYIVFLNLFFFHRLGSVALGMFIMGTFLFLTFILKQSKHTGKELLAAVGMGAVHLALCLGVVLRANPFVQFILGVASVVSLLIYAYIVSSHIQMVRSLFELVLAPLHFIKTYIKMFFRSIGILFSGKLGEKTQTETKPRSSLGRSLVIGLVFGLFVVGALMSMFSSADPIFASFIRNIFSADFVQHLFDRVFLSAILCIFLIPFLILKRASIFHSPLNILKRWNLVNEMSVVMVLVALVLGLFLVIQWPYIFIQVPFETDLSQFGVATYSEYVRKGFGELLRVALFIYGLIWLGLIILRDNKAPKRSILKYIQLFVLTEFIIFLISLFRRVWLYQEYHGWSVVRIYGSLLLVWVVGVAFFLGCRHFWEKRWVVAEIVFTVALLTFAGLFNVESFIVATHPPTVNKRIDYIYLSRMSADGYKGWESAYNHAFEVIKKYENKTFYNKDERKEVAYAGIVIRELLKNYNELMVSYGNEAELQDYLKELYSFQREANMRLYVPSQLNGSLTSQNYSIEDTQRLLKGKGIDKRKLIAMIGISQSEYKYKFDFKDSEVYRWNRSFYDLPFYGEYMKNAIKTDKKDLDSYQDKLFTWNKSGLDAFRKFKSEIQYHELLELQHDYFDRYYTIQNQYADERAYDMDVSLNSPLLD